MAQGQASVGAGVGVVRHDQGSSFSAFTLSPAVQRLAPSWFLGASAGASLLERGAWAGQGRADAWVSFLRVPAIRGTAAISAAAAASTRSDGVGSGAGSVLLELVWSGRRGGAALGAGSAGGVIEDAPGLGAFRVRARGWWQQLSLSVEATRFFGAWYTDLVGGATLERPRVVASLWLTARLSDAYGSTGAASGAFQYFITPSLAIEASAGSYLRDPFQGLPRAGFGAGGVRWYASRRSSMPVGPAPAEPPPPPSLRPLVAEYRGDTAVVRFRMTGAQSVAIAGTWNSWTPAPLRALGDDIWEASLRLTPGTYYFNLVVDGQEWVVPGGVATVSDGMGGLAAVLTVL